MHSEIAYVRRAAKSDREYVTAFREMPPARRIVFKKHGIDGPCLEDSQSHQRECDVSDFTDVAAPVMNNHREALGDLLCENYGVPPNRTSAVLDLIEALVEREATRRRDTFISRIIAPLLRPTNTKVAVVGLAFAAKLNLLNNLGFKSMEAAAKKLGCSRSYISEFANMWCDTLGLPRMEHMKSQAARESYRLKKGERHWRHPKFQPKELAAA